MSFSQKLRHAVSFGIIFLLLLSAASVFAGGQQEGGEAAEAKSADLELWTFVDTHARWYRQMGEKAGPDLDPNFNLDVKVIAYSEMHDKLMVSLQTGIGAPDIADVEQGRFGSFLKGSKVGFVDLTDRLQNGGYLDKMVESRLSLYQGTDGKYYGIEHALCPVVLYYRWDIFEENGIDPESIKTWDDFIQAGKQISQGDRKMIALEDGYVSILIRQRGSGWFDEKGKIQADKDPIVLDTVQWLLSLKDQHGIAGVRAAEDAAHYAALREGNYVTQIGADWFAGFFKDNVPELEGKWMAMPLPVWKDDPEKHNTSCFGGTGATITQFSDNVELAWDFLEASMLSEEGNVLRYELTNLFPPYKPAWENDRLYQPDDYFNGQVLGKLFAEVGPNVPKQNQAVNLTMVHNSLWPEKYWLEVVEGRMDPKAALQKLAQDVREKEE